MRRRYVDQLKQNCSAVTINANAVYSATHGRRPCSKSWGRKVLWNHFSIGGLGSQECALQSYSKTVFGVHIYPHAQCETIYVRKKTMTRSETQHFINKKWGKEVLRGGKSTL